MGKDAERLEMTGWIALINGGSLKLKIQIYRLSISGIKFFCKYLTFVQACNFLGAMFLQDSISYFTYFLSRVYGKP
jgi:uncharacterized membrane protein YqhA